MGLIAVQPARREESISTKTTTPWTLPSKFDFNSIVTLIETAGAADKTDSTPEKDNDNNENSPSNCNWNWKPIDFKTSQIKCPKALNTLLGRRFSACSPSGTCPPKCTSHSYGCTCNIDSRNNDDQEQNSTAVESDQKKDRDVEVGSARSLEDGELEEGQLSEEMEMEEEEKYFNFECKEAEVASPFQGQGYRFGYGAVPQNSMALVEKIPKAEKKAPKAKNRRSKQRQKKAKAAGESVQVQEKKKKDRKEGNLIGKFDALERADKQTTQEPAKQEPVKQEAPKQECPKQGVENEENLPTKKNSEISLSSFFEGEIGLWTTQTVDDVLHDTKAEEGGNKKAKRGPLTAERKLKKKIAKKKKKAQKDKQLGIKRLKLAPVTKPKPVILCKFYMKGRCAQGNQCPFSHDGVPITKSEVCKYHVNNCCLKGDECPFSHDLSAFPCKFYHTKGYCLDGDMCRFSHKPITEKELEKFLNQNELGKQEICQQESAQDTIQNVTNSLQKTALHSSFSMGDQVENYHQKEPSKSVLGNNQQMSKETRTSSVVQNSGKSIFEELLESTIAKEQNIPSQDGPSSCVSGISPFPEYKSFVYHPKDEGENNAFLAAREAAFNALAPVADHEANLISRGLVRVPTFISSTYPASGRDKNTATQYKQLQEKNCSEYLIGENGKIPPRGPLIGSKSAMKILEDILSGNAVPDKHGQM